MLTESSGESIEFEGRNCIESTGYLKEISYFIRLVYEKEKLIEDVAFIQSSKLENLIKSRH